MREIKFEAWRKDKKEWYHLMELPENWHADSLTLVCQAPELFELCQFTGLKDKNGKEIYEGDIVKHLSLGKGQIFFENGAFMWTNKKSETFYAIHEGIEVIGNIYENPELLNPSSQEKEGGN